MMTKQVSQNDPEPDQRNSKAKEEQSRTELSPPWGEALQICSDFPNPEYTERFIIERTRAHELYIRQQARIRMISLVLAFLLTVIAALLVVFAPEGRETLSYWIGAALVVFAAGAAGFKRVWGKGAGISFGADRDERSL